MPSARWQGAHHDNGTMSRFDILCFHTIVGFAPAPAAHFSVHGDGGTDQSRDTAYRSAANLNGNYRIVAVETEDHGAPFPAWSGSNVPAWTPAQVESLALIAVWCYRTHGIPLVACPNSKPGSRGIAFHRQGCDGNYPNGRVAGGELWSSSPGKVCPGDRRIAQVPQIIERARQLAGLEQDVQADERGWLADLHMTVVSGARRTNQLNRDLDTVRGDAVKATNAVRADVSALADGTRTDLAALTAKVEAAQTATVDVLALAEALRPTIVAAVADELARRLAS